LKDKRERELRVKSMMSKVTYFKLKQTAREMQCPVFLPDKDFDVE
jgi:hypothetical protein